jgi:14-3-3 protein epsilon
MSGASEFSAAEIAFKAGRYQEGIRFMTDVLKLNPRITPSQRESLSTCFHNAVKGPRDSLLYLATRIEELEKRGLSEIVEHLRITQRSFQDTIVSYSNTLLELIDVVLLPVTTDAIGILFYTKLKGDYYRYLAEIKPEDEGNVGRAKSCYEAALRAVTEDIKLADPIYLGLMLNYCVFQYEFLDLKEEAVERAEMAFNDGVKGLEDLEESEYGKAAMMLQLVRDNMLIWREDKRDETT